MGNKRAGWSSGVRSAYHVHQFSKAIDALSTKGKQVREAVTETVLMVLTLGLVLAIFWAISVVAN